ncbi:MULTISPECIES: phospholipid carrier-dependent glycosyltransferase [Streptomyces]|uniref:Polyprenol-phosphate-mannose--protein mannosyltransferase n=1 Tax=Streptomyces lichenis TaxID=2306967 RepID=A0ABT0IFT1_9ACTN|nr:phospholipid carrier-dependent glycosyltransferase [Streptomyces lichenis]MCK8680174.1 phospholipid carrier-dependent glycosyltransferase [Streptomyces lichenis]
MTKTAPEAAEAVPGRDAGEEPPSWRHRLRRFGYAPPPSAAGLRERLVPPYARPSERVWALFGVEPDAADRVWRRWAWGGPLLVALVAGVLRFWRLGEPRAVIFDETYYAKDAWALIHQGYEGSWPKDVDKSILANPDAVAVPVDPGYVVHPPLGKWVIGLGEAMFGFDPFGWRFMMAVLGTLSVLMLCRIGRRLFRSTFLGCLAGALLAVDGLHFVMSRTALLDLVVMFFVLAAFGCLLVDRDRARARLAAALPAGEGEGVLRPDADIAERLGLGWRPWRLAAGVMLGMAAATKWNGLFVLAAFGLLTVLWDVGARRTAGAVRPYAAVLRRDLVPAFLSTVPVAVATYLASWTGWIATDRGYFRNWAATEGKDSSWSWLAPDWVRSLWHYETQVYDFHVELTSGHTYQSNPWSWIVLGRPVSYFYEDPAPGTGGCPAGTAEKCASEVLAIGTPLLWWAACFAVLYVLWRWLFRRDWRAGAIACAIAAGWLPWFHYQERTIFLFYAVVFVPFLCLAVAMMIGAILGPPGTGPAAERRRTIGAIGAGVLVLLIIWNFIYFWPLFTAEPIPLDDWRGRMWLDTWV